SGLLNILQWYPWPFGFVQAHWWVAWLSVGALLVHLAVKTPGIAAHWRTRRAPDPPPRLREDVAVSRRTVLLAAGSAAAAVTVVTAGQTVPWLRRTAALAPRLPGPGAHGLPINRTAHAAGVEQTAVDPTWALQIGGRTPSALGLADLATLPQQTARLPISCVEGWSAAASWTGVRLRDVLAAAGIAAGTDVRLVSLEPHGSNHTSLLPAAFADDPLTLLALQLDGATLSLDHGYPCRLIAPGRPGVAQTKWLARIEPVTG
ncbi:MAG: molybdopterin-dependent oxidoreductase, partial [Actinomycetes bacterium]